MRQSPPLVRFFEKADRSGGEDACWLWRGGFAKQYGRLKVGRRYVAAHRFAYEHFVGPVPNGLVLDHFKCDTPACVNPRHVRPVTQRENVLRGDTLPARGTAKTHCPRGHAYTPENVLCRTTGAGSRSRACRECNRQRCAERRTRTPSRAAHQ